MQTHPKWKYHDSGAAVMVDDIDAETALGDGWHDLPADQRPGEVDERAALIAQAEATGVKIDKRWSDAKIKAAIDGA